MATNTNTKALALTAEDLEGVDVAQSTMTGTLEALKLAYAKAHMDETEARGAMASAEEAKFRAMVWQARVAYKAMVHPDVATPRYKENITGAAKVLGIPVGTLRPYGLAGIKLHAADRAGLLSQPDEEDVKILNASFDATSRADQKAKRVKEAAKKAALEAKAKELEALKAKGATSAPAAPATAPGTEAPASTGTAPAAPGTAPATAPATDGQPAQRGPSLEDDAVATARQLVAQIKKLRADKGWATVASKVVAILAEVFPVLKK